MAQRHRAPRERRGLFRGFQLRAHPPQLDHCGLRARRGSAGSIGKGIFSRKGWMCLVQTASTAKNKICQDVFPGRCSRTPIIKRKVLELAFLFKTYCQSFCLFFHALWLLLAFGVFCWFLAASVGLRWLFVAFGSNSTTIIHFEPRLGIRSNDTIWAVIPGFCPPSPSFDTHTHTHRV